MTTITVGRSIDRPTDGESLAALADPEKNKDAYKQLMDGLKDANVKSTTSVDVMERLERDAVAFRGCSSSNEIARLAGAYMHLGAVVAVGLGIDPLAGPTADDVARAADAMTRLSAENERMTLRDEDLSSRLEKELAENDPLREKATSEEARRERLSDLRDEAVEAKEKAERARDEAIVAASTAVGWINKLLGYRSPNRKHEYDLSDEARCVVKPGAPEMLESCQRLGIEPGHIEELVPHEVPY